MYSTNKFVVLHLFSYIWTIQFIISHCNRNIHIFIWDRSWNDILVALLGKILRYLFVFLINPFNFELKCISAIIYGNSITSLTMKMTTCFEIITKVLHGLTHDHVIAFKYLKEIQYIEMYQFAVNVSLHNYLF